MKKQQAHEEELKHHCQCEDCECEETNEHCACEDCHCNEHEHDCECEHCECDDHGCECDDCECEDCECEEHDCDCGHDHEHDHHHGHNHNHHHDHEHDCHCEDDHGCGCEGCDCENDTNKEQEYLQSLQRLQAEFDNYRKRNDFIAIKAKDEGIILAVEKLLPVLDSFKSAEKHMTEEDLKGLLLIKEQLNKALTDMGVTKINALNETFNPDFHNAVLMGEEAGKPSHTVLEVYQDGYMLKDKVIRHSMVKINK